MKMSLLSTVAVALFLGFASASAQTAAPGMQMGNPGLKSISRISFGPTGVLFLGDTQSAAIVAIATGDTTAGDTSKRIAVEGINAKVAALLGTTAEEIAINDIAVNPVSRNAYLAVTRGRSTDAVPVLVRVKLDGAIEQVPLDRVSYSKVAFTNAPPEPAAPAAGAAPAQGRGGRGGNQRVQSITDIGFVDGKVIVAGLSNEEFASTLRVIPYPFTSSVSSTGIEIFHGNHGRFETNSPIRTFTSITSGNQSRLLAAYTCTPLVDLAVTQLTPGSKVRGKTIAELGNRNEPIDMFVYQKDGKNFLLMANNNRGVMKVGIDNLDRAVSISEPVPDAEIKHDNLTFETVSAWTGIAHLDRFDNGNALVLASNNGSMNLETRGLP